jgi:hypothetical protein
MLGAQDNVRPGIAIPIYENDQRRLAGVVNANHAPEHVRHLHQVGRNG